MKHSDTFFCSKLGDKPARVRQNGSIVNIVRNDIVFPFLSLVFLTL